MLAAKHKNALLISPPFVKLRAIRSVYPNPFFNKYLLQTRKRHREILLGREQKPYICDREGGEKDPKKCNYLACLKASHNYFKLLCI